MKKNRRKLDNIDNRKLKNYSAFSASFLALAATGNSQVVYTDINPDLNVMLDEVTLDLDNNGTNDFKLVFVSETFATFAPEELKLRINPLGENKIAYSFQTIPVTYSGTPWYTYNSGATQIIFSNVPLLDEGALIDAELNFSLDKAALYEKLYFYIYSSYNVQAFEGGWWNETTNHFAAFQLDIDGNFHYGWMRLNVSAVSGITLLDYAYAAVPDAPITTDLNNFTIAWNNVGDAGITESTADLEFNFNAAGEESAIDSYHVICVKADMELSVNDANSLSPDQYVEIIPDGSAAYTGTFSGIAFDSDGDEIIANTWYQLWVLHVLDPAEGYFNVLSVPSNKLLLVDTASVVNNLSITDIANNGNASDIGINFDAPELEQGIVEYRIFIAQKEDADAFSLDAALALSEDRYIAVSPGGSDFAIIPEATLLTTAGNLIEPDKYKAFVVSIPDGTTVANAAITAASNLISLEQPTSVVEDIMLEDIAETGNGADIKITFFIPEYEQTIENYRVFLVDFATAFDFNLEAALSSSHYIEVEPTGTDITLYGNATTKDSNGNLITWGVPYYVYVLSMASDYGLNDTLSIPGNQVILNYPVVIGINNNTLAVPLVFTQGNNLYIQSNDKISSFLTIYNALGQIVLATTEVTTEQIQLQLPGGNYFIKIERQQAVFTKQVHISQ